MSDVDPPDPPRSSAQETDSDFFGEVLPAFSRDEEPDAWGEQADDDDEQRLRDEVPPHHG